MASRSQRPSALISQLHWEEPEVCEGSFISPSDKMPWVNKLPVWERSQMCFWGMFWTITAHCWAGRSSWRSGVYCQHKRSSHPMKNQQDQGMEQAPRLPIAIHTSDTHGEESSQRSCLPLLDLGERGQGHTVSSRNRSLGNVMWAVTKMLVTCDDVTTGKMSQVPLGWRPPYSIELGVTKRTLPYFLLGQNLSAPPFPSMKTSQVSHRRATALPHTSGQSCGCLLACSPDYVLQGWWISVHKGIQLRMGSAVPEQSCPSFSCLPATSLLLPYEGNWWPEPRGQGHTQRSRQSCHVPIMSLEARKKTRFFTFFPQMSFPLGCLFQPI